MHNFNKEKRRMKKILIGVLFGLLTTNAAFADLSVGLSKKYARVIYDVSLNGGQSTSHDLNAVLPAGALISNLWIYVNQIFTDSGTGSVSLQCVGSNDLMGYVDMTQFTLNDVLIGSYEDSQTNAPNSTALIPGPGSAGVQPTAVAVASLRSVPSACSVTSVVRSDAGFVPLLTGKFTALIEYFQP